MPDFDIDFCQDGRDRVIEYVKQKYGAESVSQIATFGTMAAKAVVRDVGRVLDLPLQLLRRHRQARSRSSRASTVTLKRRPPREATANVVYAREVEPQLNEREADEEEVRELLALAERSRVCTRNVGMHAGGVLIAPGKLTDFCPLYTQAGHRRAVSQFDKDDVEAVGLVKFDFLGLTTLTILDWTLRYIDAARPGVDADARRAAARRPGRLRHFQERQHRRRCSSSNRAACASCCCRRRPRRFEDIIALVALFRPGPMELIPDYVAPQARPRARRLSRSAPRADPRRRPTA